MNLSIQLYTESDLKIHKKPILPDHCIHLWKFPVPAYTSQDALKHLLSLYTQIPTEEIILSKNTHGKPFWKAPASTMPLEFSLSHSGDWMLIAISNCCRVGVDLERIRFSKRLNRMAEYCFHEEELSYYHTLPPSQKESFFFQQWTTKEALLKGTGDGLTYPTTKFYAMSDGQTHHRKIIDDTGYFSGWELLTLSMIPGYAASLACHPLNDGTDECL